METHNIRKLFAALHNNNKNNNKSSNLLRRTVNGYVGQQPTLATARDFHSHCSGKMRNKIIETFTFMYIVYIFIYIYTIVRMQLSRKEEFF